MIDPSIDLGTDYAEIALDAFLTDGVLKEIPIVKTVVGIWAEKDFINMNTNPTLGELREALDPKTGKLDFSAHHREYQGLLMSADIALLSGSYFGLTTLGKDLWNFGISKVL